MVNIEKVSEALTLHEESYKNDGLHAIKPNFDFKEISISDIKTDVEKHLEAFEPIQHKEILAQLLEQINKIYFREYAGFSDENEKLTKKHYLVCCIEQILLIARRNNWGICKNHDFVYLYNGAYGNLF